MRSYTFFICQQIFPFLRTHGQAFFHGALAFPDRPPDLRKRKPVPKAVVHHIPLMLCQNAQELSDEEDLIHHLRRKRMLLYFGDFQSGAPSLCRTQIERGIFDDRIPMHRHSYSRGSGPLCGRSSEGRSARRLQYRQARADRKPLRHTSLCPSSCKFAPRRRHPLVLRL